MTTHQVLVVEDDHQLRDVLGRGLREEGFRVLMAPDGASALRQATGGQPDAIILDVGLPDSDGRDVCQAIRARGIVVPVVFLTARHNVTDRVSGFAAGGDDYLAKPFTFAELVARLRAVLRRSGTDASSVVEDVRLDPVLHAVRSAEGQVTLSPTEFRLMARMFTEPGGVVRRRELIAIGWPMGASVSENTLDQYVARLRRKLREVSATRTIETVRGVGYRLL